HRRDADGVHRRALPLLQRSTPRPRAPARRLNALAHGEGSGLDQALGHLSLLAGPGPEYVARVPARAAPCELARRLSSPPRAPRGRRGGAPRPPRRSRPAARAERRRLRGADPLPRAPALRTARLLGERDLRFTQRDLPRRRDRGRAGDGGAPLVPGPCPAATVAQPRPPRLLDLRRPERGLAPPSPPAHLRPRSGGGVDRGGHDARVPRAWRAHVAGGGAPLRRRGGGHPHPPRGPARHGGARPPPPDPGHPGTPPSH